MKRIERKKEQRKLEEMYYNGDYIEDDHEFYFDIEYFEEYFSVKYY